MSVTRRGLLGLFGALAVADPEDDGIRALDDEGGGFVTRDPFGLSEEFLSPGDLADIRRTAKRLQAKGYKSKLWSEDVRAIGRALEILVGRAE